ncbi:MAG: Gfo/Idh/MocA family oxidoreductase [Sphingobium sp.]|nr:Gfo/Idh/MocA family oxidoreductase [Sphingobium sp.]
MSKAVRLAIIGVGKIVLDRHLPALAANPGFEVVALVEPRGSMLDLPCFASLAALLAAQVEVDAVVIATPPQVREGLALTALDVGLHVFLEKPPAATVGGARRLIQHCHADQTLFAAWHSREAAMVDRARQWLQGRTIAKGALRWREDARRWHPGQQWLWQPGGLGVFDPTINGLSILTSISTERFSVSRADFEVPANQHAPIAVQAILASEQGEIILDLDFRETDQQCWSIEVETKDGGRLELTDGGKTLRLDAEAPESGEDREYERLFARFAHLIASGKSDADVTPLELVADAFLVARHRSAAEFQP